MGTTAQKLAYLNTTKQQLKTAINNKGGTLTDNDTFRDYVGAVNNIVTEQHTDYAGPYTVTQNGTLPTAGKAMTNDVTVAIPEYQGSYSVTQNDTLPTTGKVMTNDLTVNTPVAPDYEGPYSVTQNGELQTSGKKMTQNVTVNVAGNNILADAWEAYKLAYPTDWHEAFSAVAYSGRTTVLSRLPKLDTLDFSGSENVTNMSQMFCRCSSLKTILLFDTSACTDMNQMFADCTSLETVPALNVSNATTLGYYIFSACRNLEAIHMYGMKVNFNISSSTKFTREALLEIINNCADLTGGTAQTLTMGSTNLAKLTAEDKAIATAKNWTLA